MSPFAPELPRNARGAQDLTACWRQYRAGMSSKSSGFTLIEILLAIAILSLVCGSIFSTWNTIMRASRTGLQVAATAQRARVVAHVLEDSLSSAQSYAANQQYYGFFAENGREASLSFVARLSKSFPRSGKFGDLDMRRLEFKVQPGDEGGAELVLRQQPILMQDFDEDEKEHPVVLAKNVTDFKAEFWDTKTSDWIDEWNDTNSMPPLVRVTLSLAMNAQSSRVQEKIVRIVSLPATAVPVVWQRPGFAPGLPGSPGTPPIGAPGQPPVPGGVPGVSPGVQPGQSFRPQ